MSSIALAAFAIVTLLIRKPFTPVALLGQVRRVLDGQVYRE